MRNWLQDKWIVLTGASSGIGRELVKLFVLEYGANVVGVGRKEEKMQSLMTELGEKANAFRYRLFDVADYASWQNFADYLIQEHINPVLLVNNAGAFPTFSTALNTDIATTERILHTNFLSVVYGVKTISPLLIGNAKDKSAIVNIASSASLCSVVGTSAYTASKCAVKGYTETLMLEEGDKKYIAVMYPGTTATDLFSADENTKDSALYKVAMSANKMAKKIACKILKKKKRAILGWDAKLMHVCAKLMPVKGPRLIARVMKKSKSKVFKNVFDK